MALVFTENAEDPRQTIEFYVINATISGLKMEISSAQHGFGPEACPTRGRALHRARLFLKEQVRTRKQALILMEDFKTKWLKDHGIEDPPPVD